MLASHFRVLGRVTSVIKLVVTVILLLLSVNNISLSNVSTLKWPMVGSITYTGLLSADFEISLDVLRGSVNEL